MRAPCRRSRSRLAIQPSASRSVDLNSATPSSNDSRSLRLDFLGDVGSPALTLQSLQSITAGESHDLRADRPRARTIHLAAQHALPAPDHQLAAADLHRHRMAEQHRAQVRVGVLPIAVGMIGIVVLVVLVARDDVSRGTP